MSSTSGDRPIWPFERDVRRPLDPPPELAELRSSCPHAKVDLWDGSQAWLVTGYADVKDVIASPAVSADSSQDGFPHPSATGAAIKRHHRVFGRMDDPVHALHRNAVVKDFTVPAVARATGRIEEIVDEVLDAMESLSQPVDLLTSFALPMSSRVMLDMLDLPLEDNDFFAEKMEAWNSLASTPEQSQGAYRELLDHLGRVIDQRAETPGTDLISRVVDEQLKTGNISKPELEQLLQAILSGGYDTTANMITLGTLVLHDHPDQLAYLQANPEAWPGAVEELLRYLTVAHHAVYRLAKEDVQLGDTRIRAGEGIIAPVMAANRDPAAFPEPDRLDVTRNARKHLAFGFGVHQCLGQTLARAELRIAFERLFRRFPRLRPVKPAHDQVYKKGIVYGLEELLVEWS